MKTIYLILLLVLVNLFQQSCTQTNSSGSTHAIATDTTGKTLIIVDVRSPEEWVNDGHAACSVNYPLPDLDSKLQELQQYKKVIFVCRSGHRAGIATEKLMNTGYTAVENGGSWQTISCNN